MRWLRNLGSLAIGAGLVSRAGAQGITVDVNDDDSLKAAAKLVAGNMMKYYTGNDPGQTPGLLPSPYYWWEAGAMFGQLIHYANLTGDTQYNNIVKQALLFQVGDGDNYMPSNQSKDLGNDDQVFWAFSAMDAAELGFENPPAGQPSWLSLAQAVFNTQVPRWDTQYCGGGLRWQIYEFNTGYDYKNTISTGGLFQLSARLARYTGNQTYADWAEKTWNWLWTSPMMAENWQVWDGAYISDNCSTATHIYWTYNVGTLLMGSAYMYDYTNQSSEWGSRVQNLLTNGTAVFFVQSAGTNSPAHQPSPDGQIMAEVACEFPATQTCDYDEPSFKAYLSRWMHMTMYLAPFTANTIKPLLQGSAQGAAVQCSGQGTNMCGRRWYQTVWDGFYGVGEQMSAMSIFQNNLPGQVPLTAKTGGNSSSNPGAGESSGSDVLLPIVDTRPITTGDKAGAGILTILSLGLCIGGTTWMIL